MPWNPLMGTWNAVDGPRWNDPIGQAPSAAELAKMGEQRAKEAAAAAAKAAETAAKEKYVYTASNYAKLQTIKYPPDPPPLVQLSQSAADLAVAAAVRAKGAQTLEAAQKATNETAVATADCIRKGAGAKDDPIVQQSVARATRAMTDAATALSKFTKQDPKKLSIGLVKEADALLAQQAVNQADTKQDLAAAAVGELPPAAMRLDWRFWVGLGAAGVGVALLARRP